MSYKVFTDPFLRSKLGSHIVGMLPEINEGRLGPVLITSMTEPLRTLGCSGVRSSTGPLFPSSSCRDRDFNLGFVSLRKIYPWSIATKMNPTATRLGRR